MFGDHTANRSQNDPGDEIGSILKILGRVLHLTRCHLTFYFKLSHVDRYLRYSKFNTEMSVLFLHFMDLSVALCHFWVRSNGNADDDNNYNEDDYDYNDNSKDNYVNDMYMNNNYNVSLLQLSGLRLVS